MFEALAFDQAFALITQTPWTGLLGLFWFTVLFELPRYTLTFVPSIIVMMQLRTQEKGPMPDIGRVSVLLAGHNEADSIERCVRSLREQTFRDFEIVCVSDGSTDETFAIMARLQRDGIVDKVAECQIRGGKASAINLGMRLASGDIVVVIDCDCSFERDAIEELLRPFADPTMGAVGGNVLVRNGDASITASIQAIEYMISIGLGKTALDLIGQVSIISGAFGAFRASAFRHVGGMDPGPGEDFDLTMRLRLAGYRIGFALRSVCYTDVPVTLFNLLRQRARWERDSLWIRYRKYGRIMNPFHPDFRPKELFHQLDFLFFDVIAGTVAPFYILFLVFAIGFPLANYILVCVYIGFLFLDTFTFASAVVGSGRGHYWRYWPFLLIYGPFKGYVMRTARLYVFIEEWIFSSSRSDNFAPPKVNAWIRWK